MASTERITLQETAERLGVHYMTAYRYVRTGRLPARRDGVQWLVDAADLQKLRGRGQVAQQSARARAQVPARVAARMVAGDEAGAWNVVEAALVSGASADDVYLDILGPALKLVGDGWAAGSWSVADEHRAVGVAQRVIGRLGPRFSRPGRTRGTVVIGAPAGELHGLPSAILRDVLRGVGFEVLDLGANAPAESFVETATHTTRLAAIAIAATSPGRDAAVRTTIRRLKREGVSAPILAGGGAIGDAAHALRLGADGWSGTDGRAAVAAIERAVEERSGGRQ